MKVALVYDRVNKWGGAERVLLALHRMFPNAPLYTSVYDKEKAKWAKDFDIKTSFLQHVTPLRGHTELLALLMPQVFESFSFDDYDMVISVTSESAKGIRTKPKTMHICYCLTPTRYLWSGHHDYFKNNITRALSLPAISYLRSWDKSASERPNHFVAISSDVQKRIKKYYNKESDIIFPPITIKKPKNIKKNSEEYFLLVSRLSRFSFYKKVDLVIEAFNQTGLPLKIVGSGPMLKSLKARSTRNIEFLGELTDEELAYYYENCKALIFPGVEDFGLVMAEAHLFGKPVIALKAGGALDIIIDGINGQFFRNQTKEALVQALKSFDERSYNKADIIRSSERFSYDSFKKSFEDLINKKMLSHK